MVMAEADALGVAKASSVGKPTAARKQYQSAVAWLVRSWENEGGDTAGLTDLRSLFGRATLEAAIKDQISRSRAASDLRDPLSSGTLATRLASLTALAILKLLKAQHYDVPRKKLLQSGNEEGLQMEVDRIAAKLRQSPVLATLWSNAPQRLAKVARERIESARDEKTISREITALRIFAGAVTYALQMSRPCGQDACATHVSRLRARLMPTCCAWPQVKITTHSASPRGRSRTGAGSQSMWWTATQISCGSGWRNGGRG